MSNEKARLRTDTATVDEASGALADSLNKWFTTYGPDAMFKSCANCTSMEENGPAFCKRYNMTPPASVIIVGCPAHNDVESIPF